jgi:3-methyladenine DNA glycosylase/8-oxoguanine DNA glycosylase
VTRRLTERCKELLLRDPDLDPIIDVVEPPPDLDAGAALPVLLENQQVRSLGEISALVGRLRVKPYGRIYCSRVAQPSG